MEETQDRRQKGNVRHRVKDIVIINLLASLSNANEWDEMEYFAKDKEEYLHQYIELENGVPSSYLRDTEFRNDIQNNHGYKFGQKCCYQSKYHSQMVSQHSENVGRAYWKPCQTGIASCEALYDWLPPWEDT